jgi:hypothetical protein
LFHYYNDYSTVYFISRERQGQRGGKRGIVKERGRRGKGIVREGGIESGTERDRERKKKKERGEERALSSPLKLILVILALVIYKILETSPCN